jgi:hypothetical protein
MVPQPHRLLGGERDGVLGGFARVDEQHLRLGLLLLVAQARGEAARAPRRRIQSAARATRGVEASRAVAKRVQGRLPRFLLLWPRGSLAVAWPRVAWAVAVRSQVGHEGVHAVATALAAARDGRVVG